VHVVASLPCYGSENVDAQRGFGVFERSIEGLKVGLNHELPDVHVLNLASKESRHLIHPHHADRSANA